MRILSFKVGYIIQPKVQQCQNPFKARLSDPKSAHTLAHSRLLWFCRRMKYIKSDFKNIGMFKKARGERESISTGGISDAHALRQEGAWHLLAAVETRMSRAHGGLKCGWICCAQRCAGNLRRPRCGAWSWVRQATGGAVQDTGTTLTSKTLTLSWMAKRLRYPRQSYRTDEVG